MSARIARVAVDLAIGKEFEYLIPESMEAELQLGCRVKVPFGHKRILGYVVGISDDSEYEFSRLKPVDEIVHRSPLLTPEILKLSRWLSGYYCCPLEVALKSVLPVAVRREESGHRVRLSIEISSGSSLDPAQLPQRQAEIYAWLFERGPVLLQEALKALGTTSQVLRKLEKKGFIRIVESVHERDPSAGETVVPTSALALNAEQSAALDPILKQLTAETGGVFLLFGVTGSGKTEVYLQAIEHCLRRGRGAIVLVPEISLTPQTVERFRARFATASLPAGVAVLHSHLSEGERHDEWHRIRSGRARIVIGARSAVFAPVGDLGLIIVDEEHEHSYKQEEAPKYHARDVAVMRGSLENATVILGSATPSMESYRNAIDKKYTLLRLTQRADDAKLPLIRVVDLRMEKRVKKGGFSPFTLPLKEAILQRLERGEQTMLFLNRRGYSNNLMCHACGAVAGCPRCSVTLTFHKAIGLLCCHLCGYREKSPGQCKQCGSSEIEFLGLGTERVEESLKEIFPAARIERMDSDTLKKKDDFKRVLSDFRIGRTDILIGTQMITKGLHFPNVTLVGIIYADLSLHLPDFRSGERTFQLITQVSGRAGRGDIEGEVFVQSFTPFHPAIQYARRHDFEGFYEQEAEFRQQLGYPPFGRMAILLVRGLDEEKVSDLALDIRKNLEHLLDGFPGLTIAGPAPAPLLKAEDEFRYQLMLRVKNMTRLSHYLAEWVTAYKMPPKCRLTIDIDPIFTA